MVNISVAKAFEVSSIRVLLKAITYATKNPQKFVDGLYR